MNRKQNPYPSKMTIKDIIILNLETKIKKLEKQMEEVFDRLETVENKTIISLEPLPTPTITPTHIKDFYLCPQNQINSFDNLE